MNSLGFGPFSIDGTLALALILIVALISISFFIRSYHKQKAAKETLIVEPEETEPVPSQ